MMVSRVAIALCLISIASAAGAQQDQEEGTTPGQLPVAGSYQGSMEMQRQSDAQDQQFREQQQQAAQQREQDWQQTVQQTQQTQGPYGVSSSSRGSAQRVASTAPAPPLNPLAAAFQRGDCATVLKILRPKAMAGNPSAEHNLGFMYEKGYGVPRNPSVAASWYKKSADQGYPAGQLALGRLYFEGVGIRRDLVEAYKWMYLAGRGTAKAFQYLNVIGNMLTYDQISEAMRRGQMWVPTTRR